MDAVDLAQDVLRFSKISNDASLHGELDSASRHNISKAAQETVRKHIDHFSEYFSTRLAKITPEFRFNSRDGTLDYQYAGKDHAAGSFRMAIAQSVDDGLSSTLSLGILLLYLYDLKMDSKISEDASISMTLMLARRTNAYTLELANMFITEGSQIQRKRFTGNIIAIAIMVIALSFAAWRLL